VVQNSHTKKAISLQEGVDLTNFLELPFKGGLVAFLSILVKLEKLRFSSWKKLQIL
jgi:hypothetical protein